MPAYLTKWVGAAAVATLVMSRVTVAQGIIDGTVIGERVKKLTRGVQWRQVAAIPVKFNTQHPQGMVKIGDTFYVSSVEIKTPTKRFAQLQEGYDRNTGEGAGHLSIRHERQPHRVARAVRTAARSSIASIRRR